MVTHKNINNGEKEKENKINYEINLTNLH